MNFDALKRQMYCKVMSSPEWNNPGGSDVVLHLPVLEYVASLCRHVVEFGVREGCSTVALLAGRPDGGVHSYDIEETSAKAVLDAVPDLPCPWTFTRADTGSADTPVPETDLIFFDTLHTYDHLARELAHHGRKARKFLAFHDTATCGEKDRSGPSPDARGILPAIREFQALHPGEYQVFYETAVCNGLLVLRRCMKG